MQAGKRGERMGGNKMHGFGWRVVLPGLALLLLALFGVFVVGPLQTLTK